MLHKCIDSRYKLVTALADAEDDPEHPIVTPQQFGLLVIDWTDARKAADLFVLQLVRESAC